MATQSSILAWRIPWTEELGRLLFMGLHGVGHDRLTSTLSVQVWHSLCPRAWMPPSPTWLFLLLHLHPGPLPAVSFPAHVGFFCHPSSFSFFHYSNYPPSGHGD